MNYAVVGNKTIRLSALDTIQTVANHLGIPDVDVEPGVGVFTLTARGGLVSIRAATLVELAEKFVARVLT